MATVSRLKIIDEVIYGMIPRAKIEKELRAPPVKRSIRPIMDPRACSKKAKRAVLSIPGVGINTPTR